MACPTILTTDSELLERMAVCADKPDDLATARTDVLSRIARKSKVTQADRDLIDEVIKILQSMDASDLDLPHQSQRMRSLSNQYHKLKIQLLARMKST
jgi:hypothetical protein